MPVGIAPSRMDQHFTVAIRRPMGVFVTLITFNSFPKTVSFIVFHTGSLLSYFIFNASDASYILQESTRGLQKTLPPKFWEIKSHRILWC